MIAAIFRAKVRRAIAGFMPFVSNAVVVALSNVAAVLKGAPFYNASGYGRLPISSKPVCGQSTDFDSSVATKDVCRY